MTMFNLDVNNKKGKKAKKLLIFYNYFNTKDLETDITMSKT